MMTAMLTRRTLLGYLSAASAAGLLAACAQSAPTPTPQPAPTEAPKPAAPTAAPNPTAAAQTAAQPTTAPTAVALPTAGSTKSTFDWQQQQGKSIVVLTPSAPYQDVLQKMVPDFQKLTGIEVQFQQIPEQQLRQKLPIEFNAKSPAIDVFSTSLHVEKLLFAKAGWYEPLSKYLENPSLTPPDYNWKDFGPSGTYWVTLADGSIIATPGSLGLFSFMYRKDLYADKGQKAPTTLDELQAAVKATHNPPGVFGFVGRGLKNANVPLWGMFLKAMGGDYLNPANTDLTTTSDVAVASAKLYADIIHTYGPAGSVGFNWNEAQGVFAQGQSSCWPDGLNFAAPLEDPSKSKVVGKVGYTLFPGTDKQKPFSGTASDGFALNPFGKNKEASWLFNAWASSRPVQLRQTIEGSLTGTRVSIYDDPDFLKALTLPREWADAVKGSIASGQPQLPQIKDITQFRDIFGVALTNMIGGADPRSELDQATKQFQPILAKSLQG